jgi:hypothetical protein
VIPRALSWGAGLGACALAAASLVGACSGEENQYDYSEPILVHGGQFFTGPLPGYPPGSNPSMPGPQVVGGAMVLNSTIYSGEANWPMSGDVSSDTSSVAIALGNLGTGYWVVPAAGTDPQSTVVPQPLTWSASIDFNPNDPPGDQSMRVVAIAADGTAGQQYEQPLCLASRLPAVSVPGNPRSYDLDDTSACSGPDGGPAVDGGVPSTSTTAQAIFSLTWDVDVDLDLHVITPEGLDVNAKGNTFIEPIEGGTVPHSDDPRIDRDSIGYCVVDAWREEDLFFPECGDASPCPMAPGSSYELRANLFSACNQSSSVTFTMTVYRNRDGQLVKTFERSGILTPIYANGQAPGLYVGSYTF